MSVAHIGNCIITNQPINCKIKVRKIRPQTSRLIPFSLFNLMDIGITASLSSHRQARNDMGWVDCAFPPFPYLQILNWLRIFGGSRRA